MSRKLILKLIVYALFYFTKLLIIGGLVIMIVNTVIRRDFAYSLWEILAIGFATDVVIHIADSKISFK